MGICVSSDVDVVAAQGTSCPKHGPGKRGLGFGCEDEMWRGSGDRPPIAAMNFYFHSPCEGTVVDIAVPQEPSLTSAALGKKRAFCLSMPFADANCSSGLASAS